MTKSEPRAKEALWELLKERPAAWADGRVADERCQRDESERLWESERLGSWRLLWRSRSCWPAWSWRWPCWL